MAYVATAKSLIAWVRTILERTAALDVLVVLRRLDQLGCVQAHAGDLERSDSAMIVQAGSWFGC